MSFGQAGGPPASAKQVQYLEALLKRHGYEGFRDARHPLGLTQRQGNGKFTSKEASALIEQLLGEGDESESRGQRGGTVLTAADAGSDVAPRAAATEAPSALAGFPARVLADELRRRGWTVTPPPANDAVARSPEV